MFRRSATLLAGLLVPVAVTAPPAAADTGTVQLSFSPSFSRAVGEGYLAGAVCHATSLPAAGEVVLATSVRCRVNAAQSGWTTLPGARATTHVVNATTAPIVICADGVGTFAPTDGLPYLVAISSCVTLP